MKQNKCNSKEHLRILMVEPLGDGGIAHYTYNLMNALISEVDDAILFTSRRYEFESEKKLFKVLNRMFFFAGWVIDKFPDFDKEDGLYSVARRIIKLFEYPINIFEALIIAFKEKVQIIHFQSVNLIEVLMILVFKLTGFQIVYTIHNVMPKHKKLRFYHRWIFRSMYAMCDRIIIHTEKGKEEVIHFFNVNREKIHVIPHGDYKFFLPQQSIPLVEAKITFNIDPEYKTILFFGAIRENKGLDNILNALPIIIKQISKVKLLVVGEPWEDYTKYRNIILNKKIEDYVWEKLGYVSNEELPLYFFASDIVVLPYYEVTGSGILQVAYAFSKPVVAFDLEGFRETIVDGKNGYLAKTADINSLADKCIQILSHDERLNKMGEFSKYLADTKYSWDSIECTCLQDY